MPPHGRGRGPGAPAGAGPGPLADVRVLELGSIGPGPFAGMLLADLGADVVRVDRPAEVGTGTRRVTHDVLDRGRRSVAVDLKDPRGTELVLRLADSSDVLLEGFRPGVTERLGLGPDDVLARQPRLVYGRMTGWGQDGPYAGTAGHDITYLAVSGALEPVAGPDGTPVPPLNMLGDFGGGGMLLAVGVVSALRAAERDGVGQVVDASILDGVALLTAMHQSMLAHGAWGAPRGQNIFDGGAPFYRVYPTADERWIAVGAIEPRFWDALLAGLGLAGDPRVGPQHDVARWPATAQALAERFAARTREEWVAAFAGIDACVAPVLSPQEAAHDPHVAARGVYRDVGGTRHPAPAPRFGRSPTGPDTGRSPDPGEDTAEVLAGIGVSGAELAALRADGVVAGGERPRVGP